MKNTGDEDMPSRGGIWVRARRVSKRFFPSNHHPSSNKALWSPSTHLTTPSSMAHIPCYLDVAIKYTQSITSILENMDGCRDMDVLEEFKEQLRDHLEKQREAVEKLWENEMNSFIEFLRVNGSAQRQTGQLWDSILKRRGVVNFRTIREFDRFMEMWQYQLQRGPS